MDPQQNLLSCRPGSYRQYSLHAYEHLAEIGVKHVELDPPPAGQEAMILDVLDEFGLQAATIVGHFSLTDADIAATAETVAAQAHQFDVPIVFASIKTEGLPEETWVARLRAIGDVFQAHDLTLCLETHPDLCTNGQVARQTMEKVAHPHVRVNFDTANVYYYNRDVDVVEELQAEIEYVGSVHLKDTNGQFETWHFPALGAGVVDFPRVFEMLNARGFHGPFTMEIEGVKGEQLSLDQVQARVVQSVAYLREIGAIA